jgi:hypothetical protein
MFEIFKFEFVVLLDLNSIEKIKIKAAQPTHLPPKLGFGRQTECKPCTCQDQKLTYIAIA